LKIFAAAQDFSFRSSRESPIINAGLGFDFGRPEIDLLRELGLRGALSAEFGYATVRDFECV
jgi:hypothetical protein